MSWGQYYSGAVIVNFSKERVFAHNNWPKKILFKAEAQLEERLIGINCSPFSPIPISPSDDPEFQRCVGHMLDALDEMPRRPDYAFDHFFRIIDIAGTHFHPDKGLKGVSQKMPKVLLNGDKENWESIIDSICMAMPLRSYELLAKRLISAAINNATKSGEPLCGRAKNAFGEAFYNAFVQKYALDVNGHPLMNAAETNRQNAAKLLKLYMSGRPGTRAKAASDPALDLTNKHNVPDHRRRSEVLLSLLLFTLRNERAHGGVISPFRTSKATMDRYESYYFVMLASYVYALGMMAIRFGQITPAQILSGLQENIKLQKAFFAPDLVS